MTLMTPEGEQSDEAPRRRRGDLLATRKAKIIFLVSLALGILALAYYLRAIINPLLISLLIAYILNPLVNGLERVRLRGFQLRRWMIISGFYAVIFLVLVPLVYLGATTTYAGVSELVQAVKGEGGVDRDGDGVIAEGYYPRLRHKALTTIDDLRARFKDNAQVQIWLERLRQRLTEKGMVERGLETARVYSRSISDKILTGIKGGLGYMTMMVLLPIYTFFLLLNLNGIWEVILRYLPGLYRDSIVRVLVRSDKAIAGFFRGRLFIALAKGLLTGLGLWFCGVKFAFLIGAITGLLSVIPFLGPITGLIPSLIIVILDYPDSMAAHVVGVIAVFAIIEVIEGVILTPVILGSEVGIHPLTLILAILIGAELLGTFGLLMAVPLAAVLKILCQEYVIPPLKALAEEKPGDLATRRMAKTAE